MPYGVATGYMRKIATTGGMRKIGFGWRQSAMRKGAQVKARQRRNSSRGTLPPDFRVHITATRATNPRKQTARAKISRVAGRRSRDCTRMNERGLHIKASNRLHALRPERRGVSG